MIIGQETVFGKVVMQHGCFLSTQRQHSVFDAFIN
jgi:hypothetical protein